MISQISKKTINLGLSIKFSYTNTTYKNAKTFTIKYHTPQKLIKGIVYFIFHPKILLWEKFFFFVLHEPHADRSKAKLAPTSFRSAIGGRFITRFFTMSVYMGELMHRHFYEQFMVIIFTCRWWARYCGWNVFSFAYCRHTPKCVLVFVALIM